MCQLEHVDRFLAVLGDDAAGEDVGAGANESAGSSEDRGIG